MVGKENNFGSNYLGRKISEKKNFGKKCWVKKVIKIYCGKQRLQLK